MMTLFVVLSRLRRPPKPFVGYILQRVSGGIRTNNINANSNLTLSGLVASFLSPLFGAVAPSNFCYSVYDRFGRGAAGQMDIPLFQLIKAIGIVLLLARLLA